MRTSAAVIAAVTCAATLAQADDSTRVRPDSLSYWTGSAAWYPERQEYVKSDNDIGWGFQTMDAHRIRGWCRFNLSSIPDTARISFAALWYRVYAVYDTARTTDVRLLANDPVPAGAQSLYEEAGTGEPLGSVGSTRLGWNSFVLDSTGRAAVQHGLSNDWVAVAWDYPGTWDAYTTAWGWQSADRPYMVVGYGLGGVSEQAASPPVRGALSVVPNPATSSSRIRYSLPAPGDVMLGLYDVKGALTRTLWQGHHESGILARELRTAGLSPGVYFLKLETEGSCRTSKVVIGRQ